MTSHVAAPIDRVCDVPIKILMLAGGTRAGSLNEKLVVEAQRLALTLGWQVTHVSLANYRLPLFGADSMCPDDIPEAMALKTIFWNHEAVVLANPEHNGSVSAMLKNMVDWLSCSSADEPPLAYSAFRRKAFGLISASSSPFGGLRGLSQLRQILTSVQALVVPEQLSVPFAQHAFNDAGQLRDPIMIKILIDLLKSVGDMSRR